MSRFELKRKYVNFLNEYWHRISTTASDPVPFPLTLDNCDQCSHFEVMTSLEEDNNSMQVDPVEPPKEATTSASGNENFVVIDMAGDSEDSDKDGREVKGEKQSKNSLSDNEATSTLPSTPLESNSNAKPTSANPRVRKKPKAPVVDVSCLRKRKWQLKVYPLHTDDLQLNYVSILCKLASESLLYIPSEGRHGKAELYVATQKETATIIGKLLRMDFNHKLLSIEVVRKDTGGKEDGEDSKKECKAFLMFDKFLSKKIFDAKGEKGTIVEKLVTLTKLPKEATKDFIGALFPFATEVEIFESDNIEERKATVKCKTPVTSLLVYKSFKRLEINDVHVKLSVDDSVKAIQLPPIFFIPPPDKKEISSSDPAAALNQSSLPPRRPLLTFLNKRAQLLKKKALLTKRKPPIRGGQMMRPPRGMMGEEEPPHHMMGDMRPGGPRRMGDPRFPPPDMARNRGPGHRDYPGGPGRRRFMDKRSRDRDSAERGGGGGSRRRSQDSQMTKEMLQLQNQLNQAIKNQIAMLSTSHSQGGGGSGGVRGAGGAGNRGDNYGGGSGAAARAPLLGHSPRHFGSGASMGGSGGGGSRGIMEHMEYGGASGWTGDRPGRMERDRDRGDGRPDRVPRNERMERSVRPDRNAERERINRSRERGERAERSSTGAGETSHPARSHRLPQSYAGENSRSKGERGHSTTATLNSSHKPETGRSNARRQGEFSTGSRNSQRTETYSGNNPSNRYGTDYPNQGEGEENSSYYRRYFKMET